MRPTLTRAIALVAMITALVAMSGVATPRLGSFGRDRALRVARAGSQRLESPDGPLHSHEETEAVSVPAGRVVGGTASADAPPGRDHNQPSPLATLPAVFSFSQSSPRYLRQSHRRPGPARGGLQLHAPGRAPPSA